MKKRCIRCIAALAAAVMLACPAGPRAARAATGPLCYVDKDATGGSNNGNSWSNAYTSLQSALTDPNCTEIWVAEGVYKPASAGSRTVSFNILPSVEVYGGFSGMETVLAERDPDSHVTVLSGDIDSNDTNTDGNHIDETWADIQGSNSYHVVWMDGVSTAIGHFTVLDGFTITGGSAYDSSNAGGGLYCDGHGSGAECSPNLVRLVFSGNDGHQAGGGLYNAGGSGGISSPIVILGAFNGNHAYWGGGMYNDGDSGTSSPYVHDMTFFNNSAADGGAIYNDGSHGGYDYPYVGGVTFNLNWASGNGGAVYNDGTFSGVALSIVENVTFYGNIACDGAAMYNNGDGGTSTPDLFNVTFNHNEAYNKGGSIYNNGSGADVTAQNTILWGNVAYLMDNEISNNLGSTTIKYSVIAGGCLSIVGNICLAGNLDTNPKLGTLRDNGRYTQTLALLAGSSAVDTGTSTWCPSVDQRGAVRPQRAGCDIGAFERHRTPLADFDGDAVNDLVYFHPASGLWGIMKSITDFSYSSPQFISWGQTGDIMVPGDYDGDDLIDPAVRRPPTGGQSAAYLILKSSTNYNYSLSLTIPAGWPGLGDTPVIGDYNGDHITDPAIWRGNSGVWIIPLSPAFNTYRFLSWGTNGDTPVGADVDGDWQTDIGYWRPSTGVWGFLLSSHGYSYSSPWFISWGGSGDIPVMADYDGDQKADPAVVIPASGGQSRAYRILISVEDYDPTWSLTIPAGWPGLGDTPVPADYDGDGQADAGIWRGNTGVWIIPKSSEYNKSYILAAWGASGDQVAR